MKDSKQKLVNARGIEGAKDDRWRNTEMEWSTTNAGRMH